MTLQPTDSSSIDVSSLVEGHWNALQEMENEVGRAGFDKGRQIGAASHEIRAVACQRLSPTTILIVAGDKNGRLQAATVDAKTGEGEQLRVIPPPPSADGVYRVIDVLCSFGDREDGWLVVGTRGHGAWLVPIAEITENTALPHYVQLPGTALAVVRRVLFDAPSATLWAAVDTRFVGWRVGDGEPYVTVDLELGARITAMAIDQGESESDDHLYVATNRSTLQRIGRGAGGAFDVRESSFARNSAVWRGHTSVIETLSPLSMIREWRENEQRWRRHFVERGVVATTLRHVMTLYEDRLGEMVCDVRRVVRNSKILAAFPLSLPECYGVGVATLDAKIRLFHASGMRRDDELDEPFDPELPENASPRSIIGGYDEVDFLGERVYAFAALPSAASCDHAMRLVVGMGDQTVRFFEFNSSWRVRRKAAATAAKLVVAGAAQSVDDFLKWLQAIMLQPLHARSEKYAAAMLLPELGRRCHSAAQWHHLELFVWDILAGTETLLRIPVLVVEQLRYLQRWREDKREELEQWITRIRKHVFDRESFSGKRSHFLALTQSTDPNLEDDRKVYEAILIARRHDPIFRRTFPAEEFGEVQAFVPVPRGDEEAPAELRDWRFLVGTYRGALWMFDGEGSYTRIEGLPSETGYPQAMLVTRNSVIVALSGGPICRVQRHALADPPAQRSVQLHFEKISTASVSADCLAATPGSEDDRFLWAGPNGVICLSDEATPIVVVPSDFGPYIPAGTEQPPRINVLHTFSAMIGEEERWFVVAGTDSGFLHVFLWKPSASGKPPTLEHCDSKRASHTPIVSLMIHRRVLKQIVVGTTDGSVTGWWVLERQAGVELTAGWGFKAGDAVYQLQNIPLKIGTGNGDDELIAIGSHDQHIHIVDHIGRHLETILVKKVKIDRFIVVPEKEGDVIESRVYACAFENEFHSFRLVSRRVLLERLGRFVSSLDDEQRELRLTRWRAYSIQEGHLRHRFLRQSTRYPDDGAMGTHRAILRLMRMGGTDEAQTGVITALLRRLFQNAWPGSGPPAKAMGFRSILADPELYRMTVVLLKKLEEQWDTPGSESNRRVQYFWIRSLLRNVENLDMLRKWIAVGAAQSDVGLAEPERILAHYIEHPNEFLRFKVLQGVERMLFGWPGIDRPGVLCAGSETNSSDIEWLLRSTLSRLRTLQAQIAGGPPSMTVIQIARLLAHLVRLGCVDALYLTHLLQRHDVAREFFEVVARTCEIMARPAARASVHPRDPSLDGDAQRLRNQSEDERLLTGAAVIRVVDRLHRALETHGVIEEVCAAVEEVVLYCSRRAIEPEFGTQASRYYTALLPLLRFSALIDVGTMKIAPPQIDFGAMPDPHFGSYEILAAFDDVAKLLKVYYERKYEDIATEPFEILRFEHFDDARRAWRTLDECLMNQIPHFAVLERMLLERVRDVWNRILEDEQKSQLLGDLVDLVQREIISSADEPARSMNETAQRVSTTDGLTEKALKNLFVRLVLATEPSRAALLRRGRGKDDPVVVDWYDVELPNRPAIVEAIGADGPAWINNDWRSERKLAVLDEASVRLWLSETHPELEWQPVPVQEIGEGSVHGYLIFGWRPPAAGAKVFASAQLMWNLLLQSLVFKKVALQQDVLTGQLFSMVAHNVGNPVFQLCSDARLLVDGYLEQDNDRRFAKYDEILRQARHMQGMVDAILSLVGRDATPSLSEVVLVDMAYQVVRTMRLQARERNIQIEFERPDADRQSASRFVTDSIRVYDILMNLVGNAVKYSPDRGIVRVKVAVTSHGAELRVTDEGPGIPEAEKDRIFRPFFRGKWSLEKGVAGLGLGLYVVELYTRALHGRVQVQNETTRGATFVVYLPPRALFAEES